MVYACRTIPCICYTPLSWIRGRRIEHFAVEEWTASIQVNSPTYFEASGCGRMALVGGRSYVAKSIGTWVIIGLCSITLISYSTSDKYSLSTSNTFWRINSRSEADIGAGIICYFIDTIVKTLWIWVESGFVGKNVCYAIDNLLWAAVVTLHQFS